MSIHASHEPEPESFQFNKSVAKIYEFVNILTDNLNKKNISKKNLKWSLERLAVLLQPFIPHISEEIWSKINGNGLCINQKWPEEFVNQKKASKIAVQINGKTKHIFEIANELTEKEIIETVLKNSKIKKNLIGKEIVRKIYVPGKILNFVI